jgi:hypothetical protein
MTMRVTPQLHDQIVARAEATGRSITQEAELLLEHAMIAEKTIGGKAWRIGVVLSLDLIRAAQIATGIVESDDAALDAALDDPEIYRAGMIRAIGALGALYPRAHRNIAIIDQVFAEARKEVERDWSKPGIDEATLKAMADSVIESVLKDKGDNK